MPWGMLSFYPFDVTMVLVIVLIIGSGFRQRRENRRDKE